jgi:hypothetical protein
VSTRLPSSISVPTATISALARRRTFIPPRPPVLIGPAGQRVSYGGQTPIWASYWAEQVAWIGRVHAADPAPILRAII